LGRAKGFESFGYLLNLSPRRRPGVGGKKNGANKKQRAPWAVHSKTEQPRKLF